MLLRMRGPAIDLVANDTGSRQIAMARATPFVGIACGSDARSSQRHGELQRLLVADLPCQPCNHARCPIGHACAHGVEPREVLDAADELLSSSAGATAASYAA
jgi:ADP-heptose:LPS heptosyltransferase